jgi:hypothetical protein
MTKINLDQTLKNRSGLEFKEGEVPLELCSILLFALEGKSPNQTYDDSLKYYQLRKKIFKGGEVDLVSEEITILKQKAHEVLTPAVFFSILDILEG